MNKNDKKLIEQIKILEDKYEYNKANLIIQLSTDELKIEQLKMLSNDFAKVEVIKTFKDELKIESLKFLADEYCKSEVIKTLSTDKLKLEQLKK